MRFNKTEFEFIKKYIRCNCFKNINNCTNEIINFSTILTYNDYHDCFRYINIDIKNFNKLRFEFIIDELANNKLNRLDLIKRLLLRVYNENSLKLLKYLAAIAYIRNCLDNLDYDELTNWNNDLIDDINSDCLEFINTKLDFIDYNINPDSDNILRISQDLTADMLIEYLEDDDE